MNSKYLLGWASAVMILFVFTTSDGYPQSQISKQPKMAETALETVKGTIDFNERLGGYFIRGVEPGGEFFIANQNPKVLKKLQESGKQVTIQGHTLQEKGAEYFQILKIDGKKYAGHPAGK
jgi:hypothetical protein